MLSFSQFLQEEAIEIAYVGDGAEDDLGDADELRDQAWRLAKESPINILSDKNLNSVAVVDGIAVGALFDAWNSNVYSFDVIVDPKHQRAGIGKKLIDVAMSNFRMDAQAVPEDETAKIKAEVVNHNLIPLLTRLGFKQTATHGGIVVMEYS